jgi:hypothetical protein
MDMDIKICKIIKFFFCMILRDIAWKQFLIFLSSVYDMIIKATELENKIMISTYDFK